MAIIQAHMLAGRSEAQKAAFIDRVTQVAVETLGARPDAVRVIITEMPPENFGIGGASAKTLGLGRPRPV